MSANSIRHRNKPTNPENENLVSTNKSSTPDRPSKSKQLEKNNANGHVAGLFSSDLKTKLSFFFVLFLCCSFYYIGNQQNSLSDPCSSTKLPKIPSPDQNDLTNLWGTFRPHTYFSLKTAQKDSPTFGIAFIEQSSKHYHPRQLQLHHIVENNDEIIKMGYEKHDGSNFGVQKLELQRFSIETKFLKSDHGQKSAGRWTARISILPKKEDIRVSLMFYVAVENKNGNLNYYEYPENQFPENQLIRLENVGGFF